MILRKAWSRFLNLRVEKDKEEGVIQLSLSRIMKTYPKIGDDDEITLSVRNKKHGTTQLERDLNYYHNETQEK
jgi:hypothetical protein